MSNYVGISPVCHWEMLALTKIGNFSHVNSVESGIVYNPQLDQ